VLDQARARIGRIKYWYCGKRGYGFIQPEEGGEVVFVHHTCIAPHAKGKSLKEGARVTYEVTREKMAGLWGEERLYSGLVASDQSSQHVHRASRVERGRWGF
jgi:CspA family cold shock protein